MMQRTHLLVALLSSATLATAGWSQGTTADYARAEQVGRRFQGMLENAVDRTSWIDANRVWYRKSVPGGNQFILVDVKQQSKGPAFDHDRLANGLNAITQQKATGATLPFAEFTLDGNEAIRFTAAGSQYRCTITDYTCTRTGAAPAPGGGRGGRGGAPFMPGESLSKLFGAGADDELLPDEGPWSTNDDGAEAEVFAQRELARWLAAQPPSQRNQPDTSAVRSPDGTMEAFIRNYNIFIRKSGNDSASRNSAKQLSWDGSEGNAYVLGTPFNRALRWSPDSKKIAGYRVTPGYQRMVRYVETSPTDQLQPKTNEMYYQKPGDVVTLREPALFDIATNKQVKIDNSLFPNAYSLSSIQWWSDSRGFTFEYNQRGHQVYRIIEVDAATGAARALVSEEPKTFFSYRPTSDVLSSAGTYFRRDIGDGREIIWMSERDGYKHLYLYDGKTGKVKNPITRGSFVVRGIQQVDTVARRIWFTAGGRDAGQDPYFTKHYRINFDGTGLVAFTPEDGTHTVEWSPDSAHYVDTWQRADLPPVAVIKRANDQRVVMELERADASKLVAAGFQMTEPFVAKARDGVTDIYGIIVKPSNFDASKKYPVIEQIYAGPQGSFVPKTFSVAGATRTLAEHGFIVVQIDGMGTANRSKAFHDMAWQNLGDAGFPDRILWHKAVAAKYPWYDATRVGIYGTSAGGQNSTGALLFHGDFYKAAFSAVGCHDNRMDKIWWNEQWMGWPLGEHYSASSNVDNAHKLQGDLLLVVGELDTNVDPASTFQVVNALVRANKMFDLLVLPGQGHTNGGAYGVRKMTDFFVKSLHGIDPPRRNGVSSN